jgi:transposase
MAEKLKALERENRELRQANDILRKGLDYFACAQRVSPTRSSTAGSNHDRFY